MSGQRQKNRPVQEVLAFPVDSRSEAPKTTGKGTETLVAKRQSESLAGTERLMEEVCELDNSMQALQRVKANKGSPGVDGMTVDELPVYLKQHGLEIGEELRNGTYQPRPVRRVEIPKPDGNGVRKLGIPCVLDRFVQQAVLQVLRFQKNCFKTTGQPAPQSDLYSGVLQLCDVNNQIYFVFSCALQKTKH